VVIGVVKVKGICRVWWGWRDGAPARLEVQAGDRME